jgi:hypothetical protein
MPLRRRAVDQTGCPMLRDTLEQNARGDVHGSRPGIGHHVRIGRSG